ncbi:hypothetical protein ACS0TY_031173 [Phlomoides rotata]
MATSAFKSTTKRASIGGSSSEDSGSRSLRRSRSLSRFSGPIPEAEMDYNNSAPKGKFVNTTRGSTAPFPEISLDDLALEFFSSSSLNESDGGVVERNEREGRSVSRRGEIGRWASDTASSRRRGRSVSRPRGDAVSSGSALGTKNVISSDANSRRRRSLSVVRSRGDAVSSGSAAGAKNAISSDAGSRRRRSLSVARYQISDSESEADHSRNPSSRATSNAPTSGNSQIRKAPMATASSNRRLGRSRSHKDLSLIHDGYSSHSSALTDDESKDTHFGKNGFEKIIRPVYAQKKAEHPSVDVANGGLYAAMRKELRYAVDEIRTELNQTMGRNQTALASEDSKALQDFSRIRGKYAQKLEQLEKRKQDLLTEMLIEEQHDQEDSRAYEELSSSRTSAAWARKRSTDRTKMSDILIEDAEKYFEDFICNFEDTDISSFDGERSDGSSTLGGSMKARIDSATRETETCKTPSGSTSLPVEMDGVLLPWLQWETSHDGSLSGKNQTQTPVTPKALHRNSEKEMSPLHDRSSYLMSSQGSWSPGLFRNSPLNNREEVCSPSGMPRFDMEEYLKVGNNEEVLFEMYRERNRINSGGLLLCTGILY